jgi:outer membrane protein W
MRKISLVLALVVMVAALPALAAQGDKIIRFGASYATPTGDWSMIEEGEGVTLTGTLEADSAIGPFFGFEFMVSDLIGIDATISMTDHDIDSDFVVVEDGEVVFDEMMTIGDVSMTPLFISAHFHVVQREAFDFYVGPTIGYVMYGDLDLVPEFEEDDVALDDDFGIGAVAGLDVGFGSAGWSFSTALRYIKTGAQIDEEGAPEVDIDPLIIQVGVAKKW